MTILNDVAITSWRPLPPDPSVTEILTRSEYPLPHAVAELVDNSIDGKASQVVVRFRRSERRIESLQVADNGEGIDPLIFDKIMRFGYRSDHKSSDIGMFGVGLKTSSLSQAERLWVVSRVRGKGVEGRELIKSDLAQERLGVMTARQADAVFEAGMQVSGSDLQSKFGTLIEWRQVKDFLRSEESVESYLKVMLLDLEAHLGLTFHRFIERETCSVSIEVEQNGVVVSKTEVKAINPFKYPKSGAAGWPKDLIMTIAQGAGIPPLTVRARAHIWPPRTKVPEYKIRRVGGRTNTIDSQGIYFYLNDRLLIAGGWSNIRTPEAHLALARMEIVLTPELQRIVEVVYTKDKAMVPQSFIKALRAAAATDGTTYQQWIDRAQVIFRTPSADEPKLPKIPTPGRGMPGMLRDAVTRSNFPKGPEVKFRWARIATDAIFRIDRKNKTLILNEKYRRTISRNLGGENGVQIMITLLFHSLHDHFSDRSSEKQKKIEELVNLSLKALAK